MPPSAYAADSVPSSPSTDHDALLELAKSRFSQAYDSSREDFLACEKVQEFIAGKQWPETIKSEREGMGRPCLTLDHLNQYVRHVVNSGLLRDRDVRVLAMSGEADEKVAGMLAGLIRQITQTSTAKIAYETGLRHSVSVGFGYWRVKVQEIPGTGLKEIVIRKIKEPRMVLMDPFTDYPDGRDAKYCFVFTKLTRKEFDKEYPGHEGCQSWGDGLENSVLPWVSESSVIVAEYYYLDGQDLRWAICAPNTVFDEGDHHGNVMPIIRVVGDEYEEAGKERKRGLINNSSMDGQRAYNYAASAVIENAALAPLAPFVGAATQVEQYTKEWQEAHRVPRAILRYDPVSHQGQLLPPPQRMAPAGISEGWQGVLQNLIQDTQMIMGVAQPNVLGTGGIPVQSGIGIQAQQEPGDVNTFHFIEHWHSAIEQTGRVILAMIPHVYTTEQAVKIVGEDGVMETAVLNPNQPQPVMEQREQTMMGIQKVLSTSYNYQIGRYDVAISTGPTSASKKSEASKLMLTMIQADPSIMEKAGDLVVGHMDMAGADTLSKRLKAFLPPGIAEDDEVIMMQQLQQFGAENQQLKAQLQEAQQIILGEREKAQAGLVEANMKHETELAKTRQQGEIKLMDQAVNQEGVFRTEAIRAQVQLETTLQNNITKVILEKIKGQNHLDVEVLKQFIQLGTLDDYGQRMQGYTGVLDSLNASTPAPVSEPEPLQTKDSSEERHPMQINLMMPEEQDKQKRKRKRVKLTRSDGSQSIAELMDDEDE